MKKLQNFINGQSVDSKSGETTTLINPATGQPFATAPISNAADVDAAHVQLAGVGFGKRHHIAQRFEARFGPGHHGNVEGAQR